MQHFYSFVYQVCHWWCPPLAMSMSIHLSPRSVTAGVRPLLLAMQHFNLFVFKVTSLLLSPRFGACTAGVRPFPLAMQHFSISIHLFPVWLVYFCFPGSVPALLASALFPFFYSFVSQVISVLPHTGYC